MECSLVRCCSATSCRQARRSRPGVGSWPTSAALAGAGRRPCATGSRGLGIQVCRTELARQPVCEPADLVRAERQGLRSIAAYHMLLLLSSSSRHGFPETRWMVNTSHHTSSEMSWPNRFLFGRYITPNARLSSTASRSTTIALQARSCRCNKRVLRSDRVQQRQAASICHLERPPAAQILILWRHLPSTQND